MVALARDLKWSTLLGEVTAQGAAFAARAVDQPCCAQLVAELGSEPCEPVAPVIGQVRQQAEAFEVPVDQLRPRYPVLADLCGELVDQVQRHGLPEWLPNEVAIQRYQPGSLGITPHRDQRRFAQLVAVTSCSRHKRAGWDFVFCPGCRARLVASSLTVWSASQERPPWRQEGEIAHEVHCPHCGRPLVATEDTVRVPEVDALETLHREIEHLRTTIARLRGAGFNPMNRVRATNPAASCSVRRAL
jgi:hypothetical protein